MIPELFSHKTLENVAGFTQILETGIFRKDMPDPRNDPYHVSSYVIRGDELYPGSSYSLQPGGKSE